MQVFDIGFARRRERVANREAKVNAPSIGGAVVGSVRVESVGHGGSNRQQQAQNCEQAERCSAHGRIPPGWLGRGHPHSHPVFGLCSAELLPEWSLFPFWDWPRDAKDGETINPHCPSSRRLQIRKRVPLSRSEERRVGNER